MRGIFCDLRVSDKPEPCDVSLSFTVICPYFIKVNLVCSYAHTRTTPFLVLGSSATSAGVKYAPFSLGTALFSIASGVALTKTGKHRPIMWAAYFVGTFGTGLMIMLSYTSSMYVSSEHNSFLSYLSTNSAEQVIFPMISASGLGCLFQVPLVALQAAMPLKDTATSSSGLMFLR